METFSDYLMYYIDADKKLLYSKWLRGTSSLEYRTGMHQLYELLGQNDLTHWLHDTSFPAIPDPEDQKWLLENFALSLMQTNLKFMAIVIPEEPKLGYNRELQREKGYRIFGKRILVEFFDSIETATAWLLPNLQHYRIPLPDTLKPNIEGSID